MVTIEQAKPEALQLPEYIIPTDHIDVRVGSLRHEAHLYENYPWFQREKVWTYSTKRSFIDSVLRSFPTPELLAYRKGPHLCLKEMKNPSSLRTFFSETPSPLP